jgi:hypothetical protein
MKTLLGGTCLLALASLVSAAPQTAQSTKTPVSHSTNHTTKRVKHTRTKKTAGTTTPKASPSSKSK